MNALKNVTNLFISGRAPTDISPIFLRSHSLCCKEEVGRYSPYIAVGEVLRRLVAKVISSSVNATIAKSLCPLQLGVSTKGGCEAIVHAAGLALAHLEDHWALSVDFRNAFNSISRTHMLEELRHHIPQASSFVEFCYSSRPAPPILRLEHHSITSEAGVQQGDPLGPLLFALTLKPVIHRIADEVATLGMNAWYLDDGFLVGRRDDLESVLKILEEEYPPRCLSLQKEKCHFYPPANLPMRSESTLLGIPIERTKDLVLLGSPIGSEKMRVETLLSWVREFNWKLSWDSYRA